MKNNIERQKPRILTVRYKHQKREWQYVTVPEIRLEGKWLESLGFEIGGKVQVIQDHEKLIITVQKEETPPSS